MSTISERLAARDLALPAPPAPGGAYVPVVADGGIGFVAGQLPLRDGQLVATGRVGEEVTLEQGRACAEAAAVNLLAALAGAYGEQLAGVRRLLRLAVYVSSAPGFHKQAAVADGASELLAEVLGEAGLHVRTAIGVAVLPRNAPVELDATFALA